MTSSDFVTSYFDAWNHHDAGGVAGHLADDGTYCDIPDKQQLNRDGLIEHLNEYFLKDTNVYHLVGEVLTAKNSIAFQYRSCPEGSDGVEGSWMGAEFITMSGQTAGKIEDYYQVSRPGGIGGATVRRYAKSGLDTQGLESAMNRLTSLMNAERIYLDPDLTLPQLSEKMGCSVNHLSQVINAGFGVGFFDFINQYRIREAMDLLRTNEENSAPILNIALAVGFNSTSTFYAAFKKTTGQTPAQYRQGSPETSAV